MAQSGPKPQHSTSKFNGLCAGDQAVSKIYSSIMPAGHDGYVHYHKAKYMPPIELRRPFWALVALQ